MPTHVYANNNEIASKGSEGKSIAAFPDVCFSPPAPPVGPMPLPYPNTGEATNTDKGTSKVFIKDKMSGMGDDSHFSKSMGDESATQNFTKGIITSALQGKCYFKNWSVDVKFENKSVPRNIDCVTHNQSSEAGQCLSCFVSQVFVQPAAKEQYGVFTNGGNSEKKKVIVTAILIRSEGHILPEQGTPGKMTVTKKIVSGKSEVIEELIFFTLELPWRNNELKISCVKEDTYECVMGKTGNSGLLKFNNGYYYRVEEKHSRTGVLFHYGNYAGDKNFKENLKNHNIIEYNEYIKKFGSQAYETSVEGCILIGTGKKDPSGMEQRMVLNTKSAVEKLQEFLVVLDDEERSNAGKAGSIYYHSFKLTITTESGSSTEKTPVVEPLNNMRELYKPSTSLRA